MDIGFSAIALFTGETSSIQLNSYISLALTATPVFAEEFGGEIDLYFKGKLSISSAEPANQHFKSYSTIEYRDEIGELYLDFH